MGKICRLEDDLIDPKYWDELYSKMPVECQGIVDGPAECVGIGRNDTMGWFIMASGQGPCLAWAENRKREN
jgi:hypothetical protein